MKLLISTLLNITGDKNHQLLCKKANVKPHHEKKPKIELYKLRQCLINFYSLARIN